MGLRRYNLYKISDPGFDFHTNELDHVLTVLDNWVCGTCREPNEEEIGTLPHGFENLSIQDQIYAMLGTSCGAEFIFEDAEDEQHS